jgi:hypothetical protein
MLILDEDSNIVPNSGKAQDADYHGDDYKNGFFFLTDQPPEMTVTRCLNKQN